MFIAPKSHVAKRCVTIYDRKQLKNNFILWVVVEHESSVRTPWMLSWANMLGLILFPLTAKSFLPDCDHLRQWGNTAKFYCIFYKWVFSHNALSFYLSAIYLWREKNSFEKGVWFNQEILAQQSIALTFRPWLVDTLGLLHGTSSPWQGSHL